MAKMVKTLEKNTKKFYKGLLRRLWFELNQQLSPRTKTDNNVLNIKTTIIYKSNYGLPLGRWDKFMNKLWYYIVDRKDLWAKLIYYPLKFIEKTIYKFIKL